MLRRILSIALVAVGLVTIGLAIASATVWRDSETVSAAGPAAPGSPLIVTEPGVLSLMADEVEIRATAADEAPVVLAIGREVDVVGWVGDADRVVAEGLASWDQLLTRTAGGTGGLSSPAGSDMWVAEAVGSGEAVLDWARIPGRWSLIAATDGTAAAPVLTLTWSREVTTPFLVPGLVVGGLLLVGGIVLGLRAFRREPEPEADVTAIRRRLGVSDETEAAESEPGSEAGDAPAQGTADEAGPGTGPDSGSESEEEKA